MISYLREARLLERDLLAPPRLRERDLDPLRDFLRRRGSERLRRQRDRERDLVRDRRDLDRDRDLKI